MIAAGAGGVACGGDTGTCGLGGLDRPDEKAICVLRPSFERVLHLRPQNFQRGCLTPQVIMPSSLLGTHPASVIPAFVPMPTQRRSVAAAISNLVFHAAGK